MQAPDQYQPHLDRGIQDELNNGMMRSLGWKGGTLASVDQCVPPPPSRFFGHLAVRRSHTTSALHFGGLAVWCHLNPFPPWREERHVTPVDV